MNTGAQQEAGGWVLAWQRKFHQWAVKSKTQTYPDIYNLVYDRRTLQGAWDHIRANKGSKTAGVDGKTRYHIEVQGVDKFLEQIHQQLQTGTYRPNPVRQKAIPKSSGKIRYLGIPTLRDRVVQQALRMVLEPIFEADFYVSSYAYRPGRRAQDAMQDIIRFARPRTGYEWIVEGDIQGCFDHVHHGLLLEDVRKRVPDRKLLKLVRAFLKAGIMTELGAFQKSITGTPQGGILSPLLANIYLSRLDRHFLKKWDGYGNGSARSRLRGKGQATGYLVRFADDFVILVKGTRQQADLLKEETAELLRRELRMELSLEKTLVTSIREGFDFLGFHLVLKANHRGQIGLRLYPSKKSLKKVQEKVKTITTGRTTALNLGALLVQINPVLRGWSNYFRFAHSKKTFSYLGHYAWRRVYLWTRKKHHHLPQKTLRRKHYPDGVFQEGSVSLFRPSTVKIERYGFRGAQIPTPWTNEMNKQRRGDRMQPERLDVLQDRCTAVAGGEPGAQ